MGKIVCYIGLGSNIGNRYENILQALDLLQDTEHVKVLRVSALEETKPIGPPQPDYLNGVAAIETTLAPLDLLDRLQAIETQLGRERGEKWGPRTMDLDILYYGNEIIAHPRLSVPHPQIAQREFVQRELKQAGYNG